MRALYIFIMLLGSQISMSQVPTFCGEEIPETDSVLQKLAKQLLVDGPRVEFLRRQANQFFPLIEQVINIYGLPDDFKYVALTESALIMTARSPKSAVGPWQIMPNTAKELGLALSPVDEREDLLKSTHAACRYFKTLYKTFNNFTLAAAAYNMGPAALMDQLMRQRNANYFALKLNQETSDYLYKVLSIKEHFVNPARYAATENAPTYKQLQSRFSERLTIAKKPSSSQSVVNYVDFPTYEKEVKTTDSLEITCFLARDYEIKREGKLDVIVQSINNTRTSCYLQKNDLLKLTVVNVDSKAASVRLDGIHSQVPANEYTWLDKVAQVHFNGENGNAGDKLVLKFSVDHAIQN